MPFTVVTDHYALRYLLGMKDPYGRLNRWITELQQYQLSVQHRQGKDHSNADAMSRPPIVQPDSSPDHPSSDDPDDAISLCDLLSHVESKPCASHPACASINSVSASPSPASLLASQLSPSNRIRDMQRQDPVLLGYITYLEEGSFRNVPSDVQPLLLHKDSYL